MSENDVKKEKQFIIKRRFTGKLDNFESKEDRAFNKKALASYLKGQVLFIYGRKQNGEPIYYEIPQQYYKQEIK